MKYQGAVASRRPTWSRTAGTSEHRADERGQADAGPARPRADAPRGRGGERDEDAREHRRRAQDAEVPLAVGGADERAEDPARLDDGGSNGQAPAPSSGIVSATRAPSVANSTQRPFPSSRFTGCGSVRWTRRVGIGLGASEHEARSDRKHGPRDRVLEEAAVEEGMHDQCEQRRGQAEA